MEKKKIFSIILNILGIALMITGIVLIFKEISPFLITLLIIIGFLMIPISMHIKEEKRKEDRFLDKSKGWIDRSEKIGIVMLFFFLVGLTIITNLSIREYNNYSNIINIGIILVSFFMPCLYVLFAMVFFKAKSDEQIILNEKIMRSFSEKNKFIFKKILKFDPKNYNSKILLSGQDREIFNYSYGEHRKHLVAIYNYRHFFRGKKSGHYYEYLVIQITVDKEFPKTIISPRKNYFSYNLKDSLDFILADNLRTESNDFDKNFEIFLTRGRKREDGPRLLTILEPNIIEEFLKLGQKEYLILELSTHNVFLYKKIKRGFFRSSIIRNIKDVERLLELAFKILEEAKR